MMVYRHCKIYLSGDLEKKAVATIDISSDTPLSEFQSWAGGDSLAINSSKDITTTDDFDYMARDYNVIIPDVGDLKITGCSKVRENRGEWKPRYKYKLTVTG